jgi:hypothetical protein
VIVFKTIPASVVDHYWNVQHENSPGYEEQGKDKVEVTQNTVAVSSDGIFGLHKLMGLIFVFLGLVLTNAEKSIVF